MSTAPSVLLLDDGELDRAACVLGRLGSDLLHLRGDRIGSATRCPRDLLVTTLRRATDGPELDLAEDGEAEPLRVCIHDQDMLPLRERLRALGIHFLVSSTLDPESLRLLFLQLLHQGADRRGAWRAPLGLEVRVFIDGREEKAMLSEISGEGCRLISSVEMPPDHAVRLELPRILVGDTEPELRGVTLRCAPFESESGAAAFSVAVTFVSLDPEARTVVARIGEGYGSGTPVTPLEPGGIDPPPSAAEHDAGNDSVEDDTDTGETGVNRRRHRRRRYERNVTALRSMADNEPRPVLAHDLSSMGARISSCPGIGVGDRLALAIHSGDRSEPIILEARVVHDMGERGLGIEFVRKTAQQGRQLEEILHGLPRVESIRGGTPSGDPVYISSVRPQEG